MITSLALMSMYGPSVRLDAICEQYFGISYQEALRLAATQELPVPVFRLRDSKKAPLMVSCDDLGKYIDARRAAAAETWSLVRA